MAKINIAKAPANSAVLPFYGTAAAFFILLSILLLWKSNLLLDGYFDFHLLALVHLAVLGWLTMIIFGAGYQLLPVICERDLHSEKLAVISFLSLLTGVLLLSGGFWVTPQLEGRFPLWGLIGGAFVIFASLLFVLNVVLTSRICRSFNIQKAFIVTSSIWLSTTCMAGFLLACNLRYPYISKSHLELLKLHAHMGLAGWFLQLIVGVSVKLIPMFLLGKSNKNRLLIYAYFFINAGVILFLIDGFLFSVTNHAIIYLVLVGTGILFWIIYLNDVYKNRIKRPVDVTLRFSGLSFVNLCFTIILLVLILVWRPAGHLQLLYGLIAILGWISALALGMTFKTLPFIVWNSHYKHLNGRGKIPLPKQLYLQWLVRLQWWFYLVAVYGVMAGVLLRSLVFVQTALIFLILTSLSYGINVLFILKHKTSFTHAVPPITLNK